MTSVSGTPAMSARLRASGAHGVTLAARLVLGVVMVWAGAAKMGDPRAFAAVVEAYRILPEAQAAPWAAVLPWTEVVAGACLLAGAWVRGAALVVLGLVGSFMVALGVNIARGVDMSCGCFGLEQAGHSLPGALALDAVLALGAVVLVRGGGDGDEKHADGAS